MSIQGFGGQDVEAFDKGDANVIDAAAFLENYRKKRQIKIIKKRQMANYPSGNQQMMPNNQDQMMPNNQNYAGGRYNTDSPMDRDNTTPRNYG
ncbi:unnamed protein product [Gordionus sp. m RMFG-2023]